MDNVWSKMFAVSYISREVLVVQGFPKAVVEQLNDEDMERIAETMGDFYSEQGYWTDLATSANHVLNQKGGTDKWE